MTARLMMVAGIAALTCVTAVRAGAPQAPTPPQLDRPAQTIWAGVYTKDQADRGRQTSAQMCGRCHGTELKGTDQAPGLTGSDFFRRWDNLRLLDVVSYIQAAMPKEHEFFVSGHATREIVAFMLQQSGVPAGGEPIARDVNVLGGILITRTPPPRQP